MANRSHFLPLPSWLLSILAAIIIAAIMAVMNGMSIFKVTNYNFLYGANGVMIAIASFFICRNDPGSVRYAPLLCNILNILPALFDKEFWTTSMGIIIFSGLCLSIITGIIGAGIGRRTVHRKYRDRL